MKDKIIDYYRENLGYKNLVFGSIKMSRFLFDMITSLIMIMYAIAIIILIFVYSEDILLGMIIAAVTFMLSLLIVTFIFIQKVKETTEKIYGVRASKFSWSSIEVDEKIRDREKKMFIEFLENINVKGKKNFLFYRERVLSDAVSSKKFLPEIPVLFISFSIVILSAFLQWIYSNAGLKTIEDASMLTGVMFGVLLTLSITVMVFKFLVKDIYDTNVNKKYRELMSLVGLIDDIVDDYIVHEAKNLSFNKSLTEYFMIPINLIFRAFHNIICR